MPETCRNLVENMPKPCRNLVETSSKPCRNLVETLSKPCRNLVETSSKPRRNLVETSSKPRRNLVETSSKPRQNLVGTTLKNKKKREVFCFSKFSDRPSMISDQNLCGNTSEAIGKTRKQVALLFSNVLSDFFMFFWPDSENSFCIWDRF